MITVGLNIPVPKSVYTEFSSAANALNIRFGETNPKIEPKSLMAFVLARYDAQEICAQFDLALRCVSGPAPLPNPVLPHAFSVEPPPSA